MKLAELIKTVEAKVKGSTSVDVVDICYDSTKVMAGACFVAIKGTNRDGHDFIDKAIKRGAKVIVSARPVNVDVTNVVVENTGAALAKISAAFFRHPTKKMRTFGVTGTNGKTTITYLMEAILKEAGRKPGVIGTVNFRYAGKEFPSVNTTPMAYDLQKIFADMLAHKITDVVMEVSSHALHQERVRAIEFDSAIFTNLTQDHLDYHKGFEDYYGAKESLFTDYLVASSKKSKFAIVNIDDNFGRRILEKLKGVNVVTYGFAGESDVHVSKLECSTVGNKMIVSTPWGELDFTSHLKGKFNASNVMAVIAGLGANGVSPEIIQKGLEKFRNVPGRLEDVANSKGISVFVDYAHTPDALKNVLETLRPITKGKLITVFGCGGDRDKTKRPIMGEVAAKLSDVVVVTSDNPRTEEPNAIINDILPGVKKINGKKCVVEVDRRTAIETALLEAKKNDVVLIAGKGHENYQIVGREVREFDDRKEVLRYLGA